MQDKQQVNQYDQCIIKLINDVQAVLNKYLDYKNSTPFTKNFQSSTFKDELFKLDELIKALENNRTEVQVKLFIDTIRGILNSKTQNENKKEFIKSLTKTLRLEELRHTLAGIKEQQDHVIVSQQGKIEQLSAEVEKLKLENAAHGGEVKGEVAALRTEIENLKAEKIQRENELNKTIIELQTQAQKLQTQLETSQANMNDTLNQSIYHKNGILGQSFSVSFFGGSPDQSAISQNNQSVSSSKSIVSPEMRFANLLKDIRGDFQSSKLRSDAIQVLVDYCKIKEVNSLDKKICGHLVLQWITTDKKLAESILEVSSRGSPNLQLQLGGILQAYGQHESDSKRLNFSTDRNSLAALGHLVKEFYDKDNRNYLPVEFVNASFLSGTEIFRRQIRDIYTTAKNAYNSSTNNNSTLKHS